MDSDDRSCWPKAYSAALSVAAVTGDELSAGVGVEWNIVAGEFTDVLVARAFRW